MDNDELGRKEDAGVVLFRAEEMGMKGKTIRKVRADD